jgi:hypothetical protein
MPDDKPPISDNVAPGNPPPYSTPPGAVSTEPMAAPPIALNPGPAPKSSQPTSAPREPENKDTFRELFETVVFVVVLVLMLKTFLAEAFVIPTGSMADTLLGYHHKITCPQCGKTNLFNASFEADPQDGPPQPVIETRCENCGFWHKLRDIGRLPEGRP